MQHRTFCIWLLPFNTKLCLWRSCFCPWLQSVGFAAYYVLGLYHNVFIHSITDGLWIRTTMNNLLWPFLCMFFWGTWVWISVCYIPSGRIRGDHKLHLQTSEEKKTCSSNDIPIPINSARQFLVLYTLNALGILSLFHLSHARDGLCHTFIFLITNEVDIF